MKLCFYDNFEFAIFSIVVKEVERLLELAVRLERLGTVLIVSCVLSSPAPVLPIKMSLLLFIKSGDLLGFEFPADTAGMLVHIEFNNCFS